MRFILPLSLGSLHLGHHRAVTESKQYYPCVPHSHANCTFVPFELLFFGVLHIPLFMNCIQALISIVSFCVRDVFNFQLTNEEELLANWYSHFIICFDMYRFF